MDAAVSAKRSQFVLKPLLFPAEEGRDTHVNPEVSWRVYSVDGLALLILAVEGRDTHGKLEVSWWV